MAVITLFAVLLLAAGCGGSSASSTSSAATSKQRAQRRARAAAARPDVFVFRHLYSLPAPLRDPAFAPLGGSRFVLAGGLNAADVSTDEVDIADLHRVVHAGTLPGAQHDAQAAGLPSGAFVFGGGNASEFDHIYKINPSAATAATVGRLPTVASDVAVTQLGATAYIVGGYDGSHWLDTVVAWSPGHGAHVVGHLPVGLRYAAVTPGPIGQLVVIGGTTPGGGASRSVYIFNPATGHSRVLAQLRQPVTHAGAVTIGNFAYLIGGRSASSTGQTASIWSINTATGKLRAAGRLPAATSDAAVLRVGGAVIVAGGQTSRGVTLAEVGRLIPAP